MSELTLLSRNKMFGGYHERYSHHSTANDCRMTFAIYLPPQTVSGEKVPVIYVLSGLTCTDENFSTKAGAQQYAAKHGVALVMPDTSPRGENVADDADYDLGQGAGFYLNATRQPWAAHYQMYGYVVHELPEIIEANFPVNSKRAVCGHSMGGHGALQIGLKNPERYVSVSAFAPIVNPMDTPWGRKAFAAYLGEDRSRWQQYDSTSLVSQAKSAVKILIDQGLADNFYPEQLQPEKFAEAAKKNGINVELNLHEGYDHSYFFIASFAEKHIEFHARNLK